MIQKTEKEALAVGYEYSFVPKKFVKKQAEFQGAQWTVFCQNRELGWLPRWIEG